MKYPIYIFLWLSLAGLSNEGFASQPDSVQAEYLSEWVQQVLENNPQLQASSDQIEVMQTRIPQSKALPDPMVGVNFMNFPVNSFALDQEPMTGIQFSATQMFPWPGKLGIKGQIAKQGTEISRLQYQELKNQLTNRAKQLYYELYYIDQSLETVRNNQEVLQHFVKIAESKYEVGNGLQQDVIKAQVEFSKMMDQEISLQNKRESLEAEINTLMNRSPDIPLGRPILPEHVTATYDLATLSQMADDYRPLLKAWQQKVDQSRRQIVLAKKNYYPDLKVGLAYTQRSKLATGMGGADFLSLMLGVNVPIYHRQKQEMKVEEMKFSRNSVQSKLSDVRSGVYRQLEKQLSGLNRNQQLIQLYETGLIPQTEQSLNAATAGYQTGKVDFLTLLNNQITLFNTRLAYYRALVDYQKNLAELDAIVGISLTDPSK